MLQIPSAQVSAENKLMHREGTQNRSNFMINNHCYNNATCSICKSTTMKCFCAVQFSQRRVKSEAWPICPSLSRTAKEQQHNIQVPQARPSSLLHSNTSQSKTWVKPPLISMFPSAFPSSVSSEEPCSVCSGRAALTHFRQRGLTRSCWSWV